MHVDLVTESQHESLVDLLCELHAYYNDGAAIAPMLVHEHLLQNLLGPGSAQRLVVAAPKGGDVSERRTIGQLSVGFVRGARVPRRRTGRHVGCIASVFPVRLDRSTIRRPTLVDEDRSV